jgi:hypothetical protein
VNTDNLYNSEPLRSGNDLESRPARKADCTPYPPSRLSIPSHPRVVCHVVVNYRETDGRVCHLSVDP